MCTQGRSRGTDPRDHAEHVGMGTGDEVDTEGWRWAERAPQESSEERGLGQGPRACDGARITDISVHSEC